MPSEVRKAEYNGHEVRVLNSDGNWAEIENHRGDREMVLEQELREVKSH